MTGAVVSVVIPVYNGARFIAEALDSVYRQGNEPLDVLVVDDGSTDDLASAIEPFGKIRVIRQSNQGLGAALNTGILASTGGFVAFLDADDVWAGGKLERQMECLSRYPALGYVLGMQQNFLEPGIERPAWLRPEHLLSSHPGFVPTSLMRRNTFDVAGLFDPAYRISGDVEWFARARDAGVQGTVIPEIVLYRRIHGANLSYQAERNSSVLLRVLRSSIERKRDREGGGP